jgi:hypothetical protein
MLTPKDAFRQFNKDRTGKLNFENFQNMMRKLSSYSEDPLPPFTVLRDLFNYFDKRRDGFIDIREWLETFKRIEVPIKNDFLKHIVLNPNGAAYSSYELSEDFDRVINTINKNRKYIADQLSAIESRGQKMDFKTVKDFLSNFLRSQRISVDAKIWSMLISFAQKDDQRIDYRYMLDRYKERTTNMNTYPLLNRTQSAKAF